MSEPKIVIGAGAAGLTAAAVCAERGGRVLLIEKMDCALPAKGAAM